MAIGTPDFNVPAISPRAIPTDDAGPLERAFQMGSSLLQAQFQNRLTQERQREMAQLRDRLQRERTIDQALMEGLVQPAGDAAREAYELGGDVSELSRIQGPDGREFVPTRQIQQLQRSALSEQPVRSLGGRPTLPSVEELREVEIPDQLRRDETGAGLPEEATVTETPEESAPIMTRRRPTRGELRQSANLTGGFQEDPDGEGSASNLTEDQIAGLQAANPETMKRMIRRTFPDDHPARDDLLARVEEAARPTSDGGFSVREKEQIEEQLQDFGKIVNESEQARNELPATVATSLFDMTSELKTRYRVRGRNGEWRSPTNDEALGYSKLMMGEMRDDFGLSMSEDQRRAGEYMAQNSELRKDEHGQIIRGDRFDQVVSSYESIRSPGRSSRMATQNAAIHLYERMRNNEDRFRAEMDAIAEASSDGNFTKNAVQDYLQSDTGLANRLSWAFAAHDHGFINTSQIEEYADQGYPMPFSKQGVGEIYDKFWNADDAGWSSNISRDSGGGGTTRRQRGRDTDEPGGAGPSVELNQLLPEGVRGQFHNSLAANIDTVAARQGAEQARTYADSLRSRGPTVRVLRAQAERKEEEGDDVAADNLRRLVELFTDPQNGLANYESIWLEGILNPALDSADTQINLP